MDEAEGLDRMGLIGWVRWPMGQVEAGAGPAVEPDICMQCASGISMILLYSVLMLQLKDRPCRARVWLSHSPYGVI